MVVEPGHFSAPRVFRGSSWSLPRLSVMLRRKEGGIMWNGRRKRGTVDEKEEKVGI